MNILKVKNTNHKSSLYDGNNKNKFLQPKISVIIPVYNALNHIKILFNNLLNNFDFETGEIIIVDDCSDSSTSSYLENFVKEHCNYQLLKNFNNLGFVKSCNRGLKEAKNDILVLLNSDTEIPSSFNKKIINCFDSDTKIGIASPIGSNSLEYYIPIFKGYSVEQMNRLLNKMHKATYPTILSAEGFCFCIRRGVIKKQGFLDEIYGLGYHEERDFALRSLQFGWKNVLIDSLYVKHEGEGSFGTERRKEFINQNNEVFQTRWKSFMEKYIEDNFLVNPIIKIRNEMLPLYSLRRALNYIFIKEKAGKLRKIKVFGHTIFTYRKK